MKLCEETFIHALYGYVNIRLPAYNIVLDCWNDKEQFHPSGQYLLFENHCPWKEHLNTIETQLEQKG